jgi:nitrogen regulatory protein PII
MSLEAVPVQPAVLITIIGESVLQDRLLKLLKAHNVTGYTVSQVRGEGGHGKRMGDIAGYNTNIEIKTLVSPETSDAIFIALKDAQDGHALIAYRHIVEALYD